MRSFITALTLLCTIYSANSFAKECTLSDKIRVVYSGCMTGGATGTNTFNRINESANQVAGVNAARCFEVGVREVYESKPIIEIIEHMSARCYQSYGISGNPKTNCQSAALQTLSGLGCN